MLNTEKFEQALYEDGKAAFREIIKAKGNDLYVIGFYHFGGWDGVMPMYNTLSDLASCQSDSCGEDQKEYELGMKWNPAAFPSLEEYHEYFSRSTEEIQKLRGEFDDSSEVMQVRWQQTLTAMQKALNRLDAEGVFSRGIHRESLTVYIASYDEEYKYSYDRVKKLNPESVLEKISSEFEYMIALHEKYMNEIFDEMQKIDK